MYKRVVLVLIEVVAVFIIASWRPRPVRHATPMAPVPPRDAGLNLRVDRIALNGVTRRAALEWLCQRAHVKVVVLTTPDQSHYDFGLEKTVTLDLRNVTVETVLNRIFDYQISYPVVDGEVIEFADMHDGGRNELRVYDVRDLVPPPVAASVPAPPGYLVHRPGSFAEDWYGVDGAHALPRDLFLPPGQEADLAAMLDSVYGDHSRWGSDASEPTPINPREQILPGRILGAWVPDDARSVRGLINQLRHPLSLSIDDHPRTLLETRLPVLKFTAIPFDRAIARIEEASGASIQLFAGCTFSAELNRTLVSADLTGVPIEAAIRRLMSQSNLKDYAELSARTGLHESDNTISDDHDILWSESRVLRIYDVRSLLAKPDGWLTPNSPNPSGAPSAQGEEQRAAAALIKFITSDPRTGNWITKDASTGGTGGTIRFWRGRLLVFHLPEVQRDVWGYLHHIYRSGKIPRLPE